MDCRPDLAGDPSGKKRDHATQKNPQPVDLTLTGVQLTYPGLIQAAISTQLLQKPLSGWPGLVVKVAALDFSSSGPGADQATWAGSATLVHGTGAANGPRGSYLRLFTLLAYELLGGQRSVVETTGRISPIARLTEGGNVVLRRGITDDYPGSAAMLAELRPIVGGAEPTAPPVGATGARAAIRSRSGTPAWFDRQAKRGTRNHPPRCG